jgi:hypothetical protein
MKPRISDALHRQFFRGVVMFGFAFTALFSIEFFIEFVRHGQPAMRDLSWAGVNNAKLVDALSPIARAYNNILAMLLATIGLAIPLTANMHTPKLIDMFLKDRVNQVVLTLMALGAANVLWVIYIIGPNFAPMWAYRFAIFGALFGWVVLIPYYFYVVRFLDPSTIIARLRNEAMRYIEQAARASGDYAVLQEEIQERLFQIGTIVIKSIDRADRSVVREGIWAYKRILDHYGQHKGDMAPEWYRVDRKDFVGKSHHALKMITEKQTWIETQVLSQLLICYQHALSTAPDAVSAISNVTRVVATLAAERDDEHAVSAAIRVFNTFLREALNRNDVRAAYDIFYQYRQLAGDLASHHDVVCRIASFFVTYAGVAESMGNRYVSKLAGFDLCHVMEKAYRTGNPKADEVLDHFLTLCETTDESLREARERVLLIAAGYFHGQKMATQLARVRAALDGVARERLLEEAEYLCSIEKRTFWEVTDRAVNIEWAPKARRGEIQAFVDSLARS